MESADKSTRPSLPSISSLIEAVTDQAEKDHSQINEAARRISSGSQSHNAASDRMNITGSPLNLPPPTPPLPPASSFDFPRPSPTNTSPIINSGRNGYSTASAASTNPELYTQRPATYPPIPESGSTYPPVLESSQWPTSHPPKPPVVAAQHEPSARPHPSSYAEGSAEPPVYAGMPQQRPLPTNFPPPIPGPNLPPIDPQVAPTWQHHHYYPPANPPSYPQTQERYICPTCNKPFSRPSSLKIHTYSHTGEKPYKCKHEGCGKYFSVRSNMKRHEKGCHGAEGSNTTGTSPSTT